jgi:toxin ParE1/3/4
MSFPERADLRPGLRVALHRRYLIVCRITEDIAEILRVLHGARDMDSIFEA